MWPWTFAIILVGLPAALGAYEVIGAKDTRGKGLGVTLAFYSIALAGLFAYLLPTGYLIEAPYWLIMPVVLLIGFAIGTVARKVSKDNE